MHNPGSTAMSSVPVNAVVCQLMIYYSNVIVGITISLAFSQFCVNVSASLTNVGSLAVCCWSVSVITQL